MDDSISRADTINMVYGCEDEFGKDVVFRLADYIRQLPSAEPEIIYCKDCKFTDGKGPIDGLYWCIHHPGFMEFCSDAERRTDDDD